MPEFILDHGSPETSQRFEELDSFTQGYIEALFFTAPDDSPEGNGDGNTMENATLADLSEDAWREIIADCVRFESIYNPLASKAADAMSEAGDTFCWEDEAAGRDFCYTRNGHGCGFWDGDWPEPYATELTKASKRFSGQNLYRGDDGKLYIMSG